MTDAEFFQQLFESLELFASAQTCGLEHCENVLRRRHFSKNRRLLRQVPDTQSRPQIHRKIREILIAEKNIARVGTFKTNDHIEGRCFACTVRAEQSVDFAVRDLQADLVDGTERPEVLDQFRRTNRDLAAQILVLNKVFAEAFGKDPEFFSFYRSMQAYEASIKAGDTRMVLTPDSPFFRFFNGPNAQRQGGPQQGSGATAPAAPAPARP